MKAVILCGGLGTRLREETEFRPKPMVEVGGKPILWHIMKTYASYGISDFVLCVGYKGEVIKDYFLNYGALNNDFTITLGKKDQIEFHNDHLESSWSITIADTGEETLTGGRLAAAKRYLDTEETFCVTYGDGLADINISDLISFHKQHNRIATVTAVRVPSRFGLLSIEDNGDVSHFVEKAVVDGWVNGGYFVFDHGVFDYLTKDVMLEQEPLVNLANDNQLAAKRHDGFWQPMDTQREQVMLNEMWKQGNAPWRVWPDVDLNIPTLENSEISKTNEVKSK